MTTGGAIEFKDVKYTYPSGSFTLSVKHLVLETDRITLIKGKNGSGKTTLVKLMTGIIKPEVGEILIMGAPASALSLGETGKRIGYLWQEPRKQLFAKTALEELTFAEELKNPKKTPAEKEKTREEALKWLEYFDLAHIKDKNCFYLSHGERQRLAMAAVIASGAKYLALDEPTKGLDETRKKSLLDLLLKLKSENQMGMSIISHDEAFMDELDGRVITLSNGEAENG